MVHEEKQLTRQLYNAQRQALADAIARTSQELDELHHVYVNTQILKDMCKTQFFSLTPSVLSASGWAAAAAAADGLGEWVPEVPPGAYGPCGNITDILLLHPPIIVIIITQATEA